MHREPCACRLRLPAGPLPPHRMSHAACPWPLRSCGACCVHLILHLFLPVLGMHRGAPRAAGDAEGKGGGVQGPGTAVRLELMPSTGTAGSEFEFWFVL